MLLHSYLSILSPSYFPCYTFPLYMCFSCLTTFYMHIYIFSQKLVCTARKTFLFILFLHTHTFLRRFTFLFLHGRFVHTRINHCTCTVACAVCVRSHLPYCFLEVAAGILPAHGAATCTAILLCCLRFTRAARARTTRAATFFWHPFSCTLQHTRTLRYTHAICYCVTHCYTCFPFCCDSAITTTTAVLYDCCTACIRTLFYETPLRDANCTTATCHRCREGCFYLRFPHTPAHTDRAVLTRTSSAPATVTVHGSPQPAVYVIHWSILLHAFVGSALYYLHTFLLPRFLRDSSTVHTH